VHQYVLKLIVFFLVTLIFGCATNQLHFADYTTDHAIDVIKKYKKLNVTNGLSPLIETGCEIEKNPNEMSQCVWHAGYASTFDYRNGFSNIPQPDVNKYLADSIPILKSSSKAIKISVNRIFLKTWYKNGNNYRACYAKITYEANGVSSTIATIIKLENSQTELIHRNIIKYDPIGYDVIKMALWACAIKYKYPTEDLEAPI